MDDEPTIIPPDNDPSIKFLIFKCLDRTMFINREDIVLPSNAKSVVVWI